MLRRCLLVKVFITLRQEEQNEVRLKDGNACYIPFLSQSSQLTVFFFEMAVIGISRPQMVPS